MSCAVPGCVKNQRNSKNTFFSLPKEEKIAKAWVKRLNRKDTLPKKVLVCDDHFPLEAFDASNELKICFQEKGMVYSFLCDCSDIYDYVRVTAF